MMGFFLCRYSSAYCLVSFLIPWLLQFIFNIYMRYRIHWLFGNTVCGTVYSTQIVTGPINIVAVKYNTENFFLLPYIDVYWKLWKKKWDFKSGSSHMFIVVFCEIHFFLSFKPYLRLSEPLYPLSLGLHS